MDLAKIRKKSLQDTELTAPSRVEQPPVVLPESVKRMLETPAVTATTSSDIAVAATAPQPDFAPVATTPPYVVQQPSNAEFPISERSPLEAILAGRVAAGCDEEMSQADEIAVQISTESLLEFLCFRVSDEIYGINIMDIKEIIKPREVTEVPRAPLFVSGVLSLRGTIIPIIDMRLRLGLANSETTGKERIVVIKYNNSFSGLLVDEVIQVVQVAENTIEAAPTVLDGIDRDFVSGIGRTDGRLMIILNLENISDIHLY
jgi:purine-binding chemotaxis protein CheW